MISMKDIEPEFKIFQRRIQYLCLSCCVAGFLALVYLFAIPPDAKNSLFLGYSANRLILGAALLINVILLVMLLLFASRRMDFANRLHDILLTLPAVIFSVMVLLLAFVSFCWQNATGLNRDVFERVRPLLFFMTLVSGMVVWFQWHTAKENLSERLQPVFERGQRLISNLSGKLDHLVNLSHKPVFNILFIWLVCFPMLFQNAVRFGFPVGVSGLYALMAEAIADHGFFLPSAIPFYGPGGIPFGYPPLAFYVMALLTSIPGIESMTYLRFAAPLFSLLCLAPMYLLARRISGSSLIATVAAIFLATYSRIYLIHGQAAGMARALAFLLCLTGLYFFCGALSGKKREIPLAALFFGLTGLTHPTYAELFVLSAGVLSLFGISRDDTMTVFRRIGVGLLVGTGGLLVMLPWILFVVNEHGSTIFLFASNSHDSLAFINTLQDPETIYTLVTDFMYKVNKTPLLAGPATLGLIYLLVKRKYLLPFWFAAYILIFGGYDFLVIVVTAMAASYFLIEIAYWLTNPGQKNNGGISIPATTFLIINLGLSYHSGYAEIARYHPDLTTATFEMANWFQENTPQEATFVRLTNSPEEAEWYPYLLRRTPSISSWGAEWTGDYPRQFKAVGRLVTCTQEQSLTCIEDMFLEMGVQPDYLIANTGDLDLNSAIDASGLWKRIYQNAGYVVWDSAGR